MPAASAAPVVNRLIEGLPRAERKKLLDRCETVDLVFGTVLCEPDQPFRHVHFPLSGFISLVAPLTGHQPLEMGLIGNEGVLGATLVLGVNEVPLRALVQGSGSALRMTTVQFRKELHGSPALLRILNRYLYVLMAQLAQTAGCTRFHEVEARLSRWLLMTHDRAHADHFHLTHDFLAGMLGVRRSGITIAAGALQDRGLISYTRGEISIIDRKGLEAASCECYAAVIEDYARLFA
ncbi:MAG: Crp/Fnr family transcriptional regulator [Panacagrimonas sp.]